jgi:hypothetical protein
VTSTGTITLAKGAHSAKQECDDPERCLFEWYNWLTRHQHTDSRPPGVSPVLHQYGMSLNDILPDDRRQELTRFLPNGNDRLAGTEGDGKDETRGYIALDWLIRTYTPAWLDLAGLTAEATALRDLRRIADLVTAKDAGPVVRQASSKAAAAWDAAGAAAGSAAWAAAGSAAGSAAWVAARAAARAAAGAAARDKLAPTVAELQTSAIALYDQLITGEWPAEAPATA